MNFEDEERERETDLLMHLARHELGHHVMARIVGFKVGDFNIGQDTLQIYGPGGSSSTNMMRPLRTKEEIVTYSRDRCKVALAGVLAGEMEDAVIVEAQSENKLEHGGGQDDYTKAIENIQLLRNILYPDSDIDQATKEVHVLLKELWMETIQIISAEGLMIEQLATELVERKMKTPKKALILTAEEMAELPLLKERFG
ncbi:MULTISPECIES: hypothetical protein [Aminobacter]|uniref:Peptidase M41 domain-containing protein n=2 Tax=Aminobacter TaxID=31988 RepID=A0AAC8YJQ3_AMIAI|nr:MULTISPECIES: hypothetical protein [Aminobacter]AMS39353.1 hypothetical protein AA2016_0414 [Aminobacter aminovorans]MBA8910177.1 hypothetical protein [Aminobacter ciceronei]MBA9023949.1 hypothetical protein [Aminobacter ciceronei]MBB3707499.1 hypothetical protein [Aminobacter aminovorans]